MRLTRYTDYTLRVMMYLAVKFDDGGVATIDEIAAAYELPRNHLTKIVNELAQNGFITTIRGRAGGARLSRAPSEISVGALVRMAEKDFAVVECHDFTRPFDCRIQSTCNLRNALRRAMEAFLYELDRLTLAEAVIAPTVAASLLGIGGAGRGEIGVPVPDPKSKRLKRDGAKAS